MANTDTTEKKDVAADLLVKLIREEVEMILNEPPPDDVLMELAAWRAFYKAAVKLNSLKAVGMALKAAAVKRARIEEAHEHIEWAVDQCTTKGLKPTQLNVEAQLSALNVGRIFSDVKEVAKKAVVKSSTIKTYLSKNRSLSKSENC